MKTCPHCYRIWGNYKIACDCGYEFPIEYSARDGWIRRVGCVNSGAGVLLGLTIATCSIFASSSFPSRLPLGFFAAVLGMPVLWFLFPYGEGRKRIAIIIMIALASFVLFLALTTYLAMEFSRAMLTLGQ